MDTETLLYSKLHKYADEKFQMKRIELHNDIEEIYTMIKSIPGVENICKTLVSFLFKKQFTKDDIVITITQAILMVER